MPWTLLKQNATIRFCIRKQEAEMGVDVVFDEEGNADASAKCIR